MIVTKSEFLSKYQLGKPEDLQAFLAYAKRKTSGIMTGLPGIDTQFLGLRGIVALVGEPETCKSTLAMQIAIWNARAGNPVLFIDRENGQHVMEERLLANLSKQPWREIVKQPVEEQTRRFLGLYQLPLRLCTTEVNREIIQNDVEEMSTHVPEDGYMIVVLDSLQKLPMSLDNIRGSIDDWLLFLDNLKKIYKRKLVILITCEKKRGSYGEASIDAGKESGRIEYTVEQQFDMRRERDDNGKPIGNDIFIECTKNRHGPRGRTIVLQRVIKGPSDDWDFTFELKEQRMLDFG